MPEPHGVVQLIGIRNVEAALGQAPREVAGCRHVPPGDQYCVAGVIPAVRPAAGTARGSTVWCAAHLIDDEYTELRDELLSEVLVLVVAEDNNDIGSELVHRGPNPPHPGREPLPVPGRGARALIVAPLSLHRRWPVLWVLEPLRHTRAGDGSLHDGHRRPRSIRKRRKVTEPNTENLAHTISLRWLPGAGDRIFKPPFSMTGAISQDRQSCQRTQRSQRRFVENQPSSRGKNKTVRVERSACRVET